MESWVDLGYPEMHRPGFELAISRSRVRRPYDHNTAEQLCSSKKSIHKWGTKQDRTEPGSNKECSSAIYVLLYSACAGQRVVAAPDKTAKKRNIKWWHTVNVYTFCAGVAWIKCNDSFQWIQQWTISLWTIMSMAQGRWLLLTVQIRESNPVVSCQHSQPTQAIRASSLHCLTSGCRLRWTYCTAYTNTMHHVDALRYR